MLAIRMDDETYDAAGAWHRLERCPGLHRDEGWSCHPACEACHLGPIDDYDGPAHDANAVLAYLHLLPSARLLRGMAADLGSNSWSVRLHEHVNRFADDTGRTFPAWSVMVKERSDERLHVCLYASHADADLAYDSIATDLDEEGLGIEHFNANVRGGSTYRIR